MKQSNIFKAKNFSIVVIFLNNIFVFIYVIKFFKKYYIGQQIRLKNKFKECKFIFN